MCSHLVCNASPSAYTRWRCAILVLDQHQHFFLFSCRLDPIVEEGRIRQGEKNTEDKKGDNVKEDTQEKQSSKKKGKGKKGKKGKGRGKKSNREASERDKTALKEFLDSLKGTRRLMVRNVSFV